MSEPVKMRVEFEISNHIEIDLMVGLVAVLSQFENLLGDQEKRRAIYWFSEMANAQLNQPTDTEQ